MTNEILLDNKGQSFNKYVYFCYVYIKADLRFNFVLFTPICYLLKLSFKIIGIFNNVGFRA